MLTKERARLIWSIVSAQGLWQTLLERVQFARPSKGRAAPADRDESLPSLPRFNDYVGAAHIHSTYSDGTSTVREIAAAGGRSGLDFIIFADHNTTAASEDGEEVWQADNRVLILVGSEVTTSEGHLLAFDTPPSFYPAPHDARECMRAIHDCGGYGYIALPCDLKGHWGDFSVREPGIGIEVFNLSAIARTKINVPGFLLALLRYRGADPLAAYSLVIGRPYEELRVWDRMLVESARRGEKLPHTLGCLDAHAVMRIGGREFPYPSYEEVFRTLRTHILTTETLSFSNENVRRDLKIVHDAVRSGRVYASFDNFGDPRGFLVELRKGGEYVGTTGETYEIDESAAGACVLAVRVPQTRSVIRVYRDGRLVEARRGGALDYPIAVSGVYRIEVLIYRNRIGDICFGARPWIYSNALNVRLLRSASHPAAVSSATARPGEASGRE